MIEPKDAKKTNKFAPAVDRCLLDLETDDDLPEPEFDPYAGRLFGDQLDYDESEDSEYEVAGGRGLFSF
jgi:hypothetical protein